MRFRLPAMQQFANCGQPDAESFEDAGRIALLRRPQRDADKLPFDPASLPIGTFDPDSTRRASAVFVVPSTEVSASGRCGDHVGPGLCLVARGREFRCFTAVEVAWGRAVARTAAGTLAGIAPDGVGRVFVRDDGPPVAAEVVENVYEARIGFPAGEGIEVAFQRAGDSGCRRSVAPELLAEVALLRDRRRSNERLPRSAHDALTHWPIEAIHDRGARYWGGVDGIDFWAVPVVPWGLADCAPASSVCVVAIPGRSSAAAECDLGRRDRNWWLGQRFPERAMMFGTGPDGVTGVRLTHNGETAVLNAHDNVFGGALPWPYEVGDHPRVRLIRGDDDAGRLAGIVDAGGPVRDMVGRLRARGYLTLELITPAGNVRSRSIVYWWPGRAGREDAYELAEVAGVDQVEPIRDTDRIPLPVLETHAPFVVVVGARLAPLRRSAARAAVRHVASPLPRPSRAPPARRRAVGAGRARVRLAVAAAVPDRGARRPRRAPPDGRRRRRRPPLARARAGPARLAAPARGALLPEPRRRVRVAPHAARPPRRPRVAALDALLDRSPGAEAPVIVISAVALSEKVPDPALRPHGFTLRVGDLLDLDECASDLVAAGYERVDQVEDRGQFAVRGGLLDVYPATEERAIRVDLFDDEIESLRWFSTFTQRSLGDTDVVEIAPAAELAAEHRELAEIAALENPEERPDIAELLPVGDFRDLLELIPAEADVILAAEEDTEPALRDHWDDVCAAFHDSDAHHLYVKPDGILGAARRAPAGAAVLDQRLAAARVPRPGGGVRRAQPARGRAGAGEARPLGLHGARHVAEPRRRRARRLQPRADQGALGRHRRGARLPGGQPARRLRRARPEARGRSRSTG